MAVHVPI